MSIIKKLPIKELILSIFSIYALFPLFYLVSMSFQSDKEVSSIPPTILPESLMFENFVRVLNKAPLATWFFNSFIYSFVAVVLVVITSTLAAHALTNLNLPGSGIITLFFISSILVPPQVRAFPLYTLIVKWGWVDTWQGMILPFAATGFSLFFMRQFMLTIPKTMVEAGRIDGASEMQILTKLIMPLSKPGIITISLYTFIFRWNDFMWPLLVTRKKLTTLTVGMSIFKVSEQLITWNLIAAASMFLIIPIIFLFLFLRPYIMESVAIEMK